MECGVELQGGDLGATTDGASVDPIVGFGAMDHETETLASVAEREMWLNTDDDASMFYAEFPPLPDFPCMSSSSSSSSTPVALPLNNIACSTSTCSSSSSSAASWAVLRPDNNNCEENSSINFYMQNNDNNNNNNPVDAPFAAVATGGGGGPLSSTASMEISQQNLLDDQNCFNSGGVGDCMDDVMDTFGYMELLESNDFFDPSSIFQDDENPLEEFTQDHQMLQQQTEEGNQHAIVGDNNLQDPPPTGLLPQQGAEEGNNNNNHHQVLGVCGTINNNNNNDEEIQLGEDGIVGSEGIGANDEMSMVFLEWLKSNKDSVSASDLRNVKLKRSTIESAARRLGGGKEGMKQLLKLILEWVQTSHLQNKRRKENNNNNNNIQFQDPISQNQNTAFAPEPNSGCFNQTTWMSSSPPQPYGTDQAPLAAAATQSFQQPMVGYVGEPYTNGASANNMNGNEYHMLESATSWPPSHQYTVAPNYNQSFGDNSIIHPPQGVGGGYGNQYPYQFYHGPSDGLMRLGPSATKEARKKRMARQRRFSAHPRHHNHHHNHQGSDLHARLGSDNCSGVLGANPGNWVYWQTMAGGGASMTSVGTAEQPAGQQVLDRTAMQTQNYHQGGRVSADRRQGWKPEKNLRFLLQKVLKQSDVGSLGRIVLPKKEAETHLPELEARDGISITMEDIGTSRVWNMRYRYWPNNKSRMYLLENTGDFVRANGLQEGDFIVIYSDVKCGKFMIRGVKVRQQGAKSETKKAGKLQKNQHGNNAATTAGAATNNGIPSLTQQKNEKVVK